MTRKPILSPTHPLFDDIRRNHGFIGVRGRPDLAAQIVEGASSPALRKLLIALSEKESPFLSLGCDLGEHERRGEPEATRFATGGYIQWVLTPPSYDTDKYEASAETLAQKLDTQSEGHVWEVSFRMKFVDLKLDEAGLVPSHWIWFDACAPSYGSAREPREQFLESLHKAAFPSTPHH